MNLPKVTQRQRDIIDLLYKYRFLNRIQIQALLEHKDYKTINTWLRDLRAKQYIDWIYSTDYGERTKPAIYYLSLNAIRKIKEHDLPIEEVRKRYRDSSRSQSFIERCVLIGDCAVILEQTETNDKVNHVVTNYFLETEADYMSDTYFGFLVGNEFIHPNLCYQKLVHNGSDESYAAKSYLLEIFDPTLPRYRIKKRLANYVQYLDEEGEDWKDETNTEKLPIIQLVCPRTSDLIYAKRRTRGLIADIWEYDDEGRADIHIQFTTIDKLKELGVIGDIWEEA
jgi:hypothetical protein